MQELTQYVATCQACKDKALQNEKAFILFGELTRAGLASVLGSHCTGSLQEFRFSTSSKVQGMTGGNYWEANLAAVWGQMCTGGGQEPLAEAMTVLGIQTMSKQLLCLLRGSWIGEWWRDLFEQSMTSAGKEERDIAIANNSYHQGIPAVTVIVDGGQADRQAVRRNTGRFENY